MNLSDNEMDVISHSLGLNWFHAVRSLKKKDKKLPNEYYRNRFCTSQGSEYYKTIIGLVEKGFMNERMNVISPDQLFMVTEIGKAEFKRQWNETFNR